MSEEIAAEAPREPADAPALAAAPHPLEAVVDRWWADHFPGSLLARDTHVWNHAHAAVQDLKRRLSNVS